jgi:hypothetical protein
VGLIFTTYNLKRIFSLIEQNELIQDLKTMALFFEAKITLFKAFLGSFLVFPIYKEKLIVI